MLQLIFISGNLCFLFLFLGMVILANEVETKAKIT